VTGSIIRVISKIVGMVKWSRLITNAESLPLRA